ncbi:siroheme synthase [Erythrobacter sp. SCSIO 43205]|uniref:precorrin-2 dehydrogenase/sirohydrochlorin ferrochelatase family protein n=1 Tax=Erythrobacter sp. SCSIO 43205 TaxID=2779361 RepID=UPI001CA80B9D|nr:bifunctional precorrin-2 dehydrogenase/sirohydrochlorin ferrochelatase [Erythrobacter sp. SCSIO 43205]UAB79391.1 siroheme synthase [Erythrobacter sp. SCSIO 43205]
MSELQSLPLFHNLKGQKVLVLGEGEAAEPKRRLVERAGAIIEDDQQRAIDEGVRIAFVAYEDAKACEVSAINLRCAGMLVNVVDRPELCDFTTPSILDRNPVLIAVGTGGASAGLAKHLRLRLERILPSSLGALARALYDARPKLRQRFPNAAERRRALDGALREGGALDALDERSSEKVGAWLDNGATTKSADTLAIKLIGDDPEELTLRQARALGEADVVCSEAGTPPEILARARADAVRVVCAKEPACRQDQCPYAAPDGLTVIIRCPD